jgi:hypothetical protein
MPTPLQLLPALLGMSPSPESLSDWHERVACGFPGLALETLSLHTGLKPRELTASLQGKTPPKQRPLSPEVSSGLFRTALAWVALQDLFPGSTAKATAWLRCPQATLRGRIPLNLLATSLGFDYVMAAISRQAAN